MTYPTRKLLTIITEAALESQLIKDFEELGATGYTITDARGKGGRGVRNASWGHSTNIRIEIVCEERIAERIAAHLREHYYDNYAMILMMNEVAVLRPQKF